MSSIYIHIPFCNSRCHYCDFYSTLYMPNRPKFIRALKSEITEQKNFLENKRINTLYIGGGTPSVLRIDHLQQIVKALRNVYEFHPEGEWTIEANPDDLSDEYLGQLLDLGFNRISIGLQTFNNKALQMLGRRHDAKTALKSVKLANLIGFENISIDLIYGWPGQNVSHFSKDLKIATDLPVQHLSAYHLTYEKGTNLYKALRANKISAIDEDTSVALYDHLVNWANIEGFIHYEISNFAQPGFYSRHNRNYWLLREYLGLGPAAHSFQEPYRYWNPRNLTQYISHQNSHSSVRNYEELSLKELFNDYIITALRTCQGISFAFVSEKFGNDYVEYLEKYIYNSGNHSGLIQLTIDGFHLTEHGFLFSDKILKELLIMD